MASQWLAHSFWSSLLRTTAYEFCDIHTIYKPTPTNSPGPDFTTQRVPYLSSPSRRSHHQEKRSKRDKRDERDCRKKNRRGGRRRYRDNPSEPSDSSLEESSSSSEDRYSRRSYYRSLRRDPSRERVTHRCYYHYRRFRRSPSRDSYSENERPVARVT
jgi:hypothetical protein